VFDASPQKKRALKGHAAKAQAIMYGVSASPGIAIGKVFLLPDEQMTFEPRIIAEIHVPAEIERLQGAIAKARADLQQDNFKTGKEIGQEEARIFEFHRMMLEDEYFIGEIMALIRKQRLSAAQAFAESLNRYADHLDTKDKIFRERAADVHDIKRRVLRHLHGEKQHWLDQVQHAAIVITHDLTPSLTQSLDRQKIKAFATDLGGKTSHAAILLRSYGIPTVVGLHNITGAIKNGDRVIVDGDRGVVLVNPDKATAAHYEVEQNKREAKTKRLEQLRDLPAHTLDNRHVELAANVEFAEEVEAVMKYGAAGIGLLRSEYLYLGRADLPTEEEQFLEYSRVADAAHPHPVIIRTMDLGADKCPQCIEIPPEANPMLGWRAIRISLERPEIFIAQISAILRANMRGNVRILLPMISSITELEKAIALIEKTKHELEKQGHAFEPNTPIGVMIEVPSAALLADAIAARVDFFSIGTNDLVQYLLAVDRGNDRIAHLYENLNPAVLRVIKNVIDAGHRQGVWVGMCGEMAADRLATALLIGMGIDELSVSSIDVPEIKKIIRGTSFREARKLARQALKFSTAQEISEFMRHYMRPRFKDMILP
jgi:phosphotransferase system enzyme I (PtsI)